MSLTFLTFYASVKGEDETFVVHPHGKTTHEQSIAMIGMLFGSAARFNPEARFTILTSAATDLSGVAMPFTRIDIDVDRRSLMLDRAVGYAKQVEALELNETLVLLDTDIIVQGDLSHLTEADFDVAVTWRRATVPINGGFLVARNRGGGGAAAFFQELLDIFRRDHAASCQWDGDQLALRTLLPAVRPWTGRALPSLYAKARVHLLHSDFYNHSPADDPAAFDRAALKNRLVVHFKGHRKRFMLQYFREIMSASLCGPVARYQAMQPVADILS